MGLATDSNGKATEFSLCACRSEHIQTFWTTATTFFICFFVWFGNLGFLPWIVKDIDLSSTDVAIAKSVLVLSNIVSRVIIGDLCDKIGPRYSYMFILIMSLIPVCFLSLISSSFGYIVCNLFIGIIGSSFVITEYHTTKFFVDRLIGLANGTAAGWGNFGGGCAALFMPLLASHGFNWRHLSLGLGLLLIVPICLYYRLQDSPNGRLNRHEITKAKLLDFSSLKEVARDYRTWILFVVYAQCFGVELSIISFVSDYYRNQFDLSYLDAGIRVFIFSSLNIFARSVGGYGTDMLYIKFGIQGRVYTLFLVLLAESIFLFIFAFASFDLNYSMLIMLLFSFYVQCAEGITYAIVPFVKPNKIGPMYGIVASGGTFGSFLFSITVFWFAGNELKYHFSFIILSICVFCTSFLTLYIRFTPKEVRCADELLKSFLKKHNIRHSISAAKKNRIELQNNGAVTIGNGGISMVLNGDFTEHENIITPKYKNDDIDMDEFDDEAPAAMDQQMRIRKRLILAKKTTTSLPYSSVSGLSSLKKIVPKLVYKSTSLPTISTHTSNQLTLPFNKEFTE